MKLNIAICEDEQNQVEFIKRAASLWTKTRGYLPVFSEFPSAEAFLFEYGGKRNIDILLLDIEMAGMNGIELAKKIREDNTRVQIIFVTGYPDFMAEGFEVAALHYLIKPVKKEKLFAVLDRAAEKLKGSSRFVLLPVGKETVRIYVEDIRYAESDGHYILLHVGKETYRLRMTVSEIEKALGQGFFRSGRSFIVGLRYVIRITKTSVYLEGGIEVPLGKGLYDEMNQALVRYLREQ
ncbi:MAG: response regulator transcription factor [Lachnospiraceae bacterium]|nr:response regulator transcription factor [Lachnospiraceae bacterium]